VPGGVVLADGDAAIGEPVERVEHTQEDAGAHKAFQRDIDLILGDQPLMHRIDQRGISLSPPEAAFEVRASFDRSGRCVGKVRRVVVADKDIGDGRAVADHLVPGVAQMLLQQHGIGAGRSAIDGVISTHHRLCVRLSYRGAEDRQVSILEVVRGDIDVGTMARRLRAGVDGVVFERGDHAEELWIIALHADHKGHAHAAGQVRVLTLGFLSSSPARIAEDIDIRRPEGETEELLLLLMAHGFVVLGARFGGGDLAHAVNQRCIPRGPHSNHLREVRRVARKRGAMEALVCVLPSKGAKIMAERRAAREGVLRLDLSMA